MHELSDDGLHNQKVGDFVCSMNNWTLHDDVQYRRSPNWLVFDSKGRNK